MRGASSLCCVNDWCAHVQGVVNMALNPKLMTQPLCTHSEAWQGTLSWLQDFQVMETLLAMTRFAFRVNQHSDTYLGALNNTLSLSTPHV